MVITTENIMQTKDVDSVVAKWGARADEHVALSKRVKAELLRRSPNVDSGNFVRLGRGDLRILLNEYDALYFAGGLSELFRAIGAFPISLRLSRRMTRRGGSTKFQHTINSTEQSAVSTRRIEIAIAVDLLFDQFDSGDRDVEVNGLGCSDRLDALQRIFEHELIHALEFAIWGSSSCKKGRFQKMAGHIFGHIEFTHRMITRNERAHTELSIRPGSLVAFSYRGSRFEGLVNRINKRATVLVRSDLGEPYGDGNRYAKYYVPLGELTVV